MSHKEKHHTGRTGWLRAAVLGANDGIVSTASLIIGVAAAGSEHSSILVAGIAGLVAGAMSMSAGEYVSVHSQADIEKADLEREKKELALSPEHELQELAGIYRARGVDREISLEVARQLTAHDALAAHARDELGISEVMSARPIQAAVFSAVSFAIGAALPLAVAALYYGPFMTTIIGGASLAFLALLGAVAARAGGAKILTGALRVLFWGAMAMAATALVGKLFGTIAA